MPIHRAGYALVAIFAACLVSASVASAAFVPPGLPVGAEYQLAFITDGARSGDSADITIYNGFVTAEASLNPTLTGAGGGVDWFAIASTASDDARDNAAVGASTPVYLLDGTKIADGFNDMWDGDLDAPLNVNQFGSVVPNTSVVTGTKDNGEGADPAGSDQLTLGFGGNIGVGFMNPDTTRWVQDGTLGYTTPRPFYAISSTLIVVPEPVSAAGFAVVAPVVAWRRARRR